MKKMKLILLIILVVILSGCNHENEQVKLLDTIDQIQGMEDYEPSGTLSKSFSENVVYEVSDISWNGNSGIAEVKVTTPDLIQSDLYSDLHSDKGEEFVEAIENTLSVAAEPTQWYIQYYYNAIEKSFVSLAYDAFEAGQHADVKHYGEKFYEAFTKKNKTSDTAEKYFDNADYVMLFVSAAVD